MRILLSVPRFDFAEEKKNKKGKGGKCLEKENLFSCRGEGKRGKYLEKENIFFVEKRSRERKYLLKENMFE